MAPRSASDFSEQLSNTRPSSTSSTNSQLHTSHLNRIPSYSNSPYYSKWLPDRTRRAFSRPPTSRLLRLSTPPSLGASLFSAYVHHLCGVTASYSPREITNSLFRPVLLSSTAAFLSSSSLRKFPVAAPLVAPSLMNQVLKRIPQILTASK